MYRRELNVLSDELWLGTVRVAIQRERWLPPVATLLEYAKELHEAPYAGSAGLLGVDCRTREEKRQDAIEGMDVFKRELRKRGVNVDELESRFSWPGAKRSAAREPGQEG